PAGVEDPTVELLQRLRDRPATEDRIADIRSDLQETMATNVEASRSDETCRQALANIVELKKRYETVAIQDKGMRYNLDLMEAVELGFLLDLAEVVALGALYRKESRGGHFREDYETRDDATFLHHTMAYRTLDGEEGSEGTSIRLVTTSVFSTRYEPNERTFCCPLSPRRPRPPRPAPTRSPRSMSPCASPVSTRSRSRAPTGRTSPSPCTAPTGCWTPCTRSSGTWTGP